ncbi:hypothetical protein I8752_08905 [Nostocaceae cyanobacterium CENA369]|uniref:Uncharacterized protein n=1 Tax=Dendronalium phyllosphericum CENA369 TaxID=1725256 RepID=A0A8J7I6D1_9NOST|nr:hypothetical protein [Dendronalium phyllosphericum]MBH8573132.1 hypothetical protein [Dendronalium phyllosphericum CENA369]
MEKRLKVSQQVEVASILGISIVSASEALASHRNVETSVWRAAIAEGKVLGVSTPLADFRALLFPKLLLIADDSTNNL